MTKSEQRTRFTIRQVDPVRQWKLSPVDLESLDKWDRYTAAKEEMFRRTDIDLAPWTTIKSNDKKRARLDAMRHFLSRFEYDGEGLRRRRTSPADRALDARRTTPTGHRMHAVRRRPGTGCTGSRGR